jgi:hypothetical protein
MIRVPQPPVQANLRDPERHGFWPPLVITLIAVILMGVGVRHVTGIETVEGGEASELQLVKAFSRGGLEQVDAITVLDPATFDNPEEAAAALEALADAEVDSPLFKFRVNTGAVDPCPT